MDHFEFNRDISDYIRVPVKVMGDRRVRPPLLHVLLCLCKRANPDGVSWMTAQTISELTGYCAANIGGHILELRELGYVRFLRPRQCAGHMQADIMLNPLVKRVQVLYMGSASAVPKNELILAPKKKPRRHAK